MLRDYMDCPKCNCPCAFIQGEYDYSFDRVKYSCLKCRFKALVLPADHPDRRDWWTKLWAKWF